ncbi:MAG: hypothetical protein PHQ05_12725 [Sterolibacterium sp.]|nr:hypothetical protein [Sterolibacterium sp.]
MKLMAAMAGLLAICCGGQAWAASPATTRQIAVATAEERVLEYDRLLRTAERYLSEGDYPAALDNLHQALARRPGDARFYKMLAVAYDADREPAKAFGYFEKAGELYLDEGDLVRAAHLLEVLRASGREQPRVAVFERKLEARRLKRP